MCGIGCYARSLAGRGGGGGGGGTDGLCCCNAHAEDGLSARTRDSLRRRGPDGWGRRELRGGRITLLAAVLHLRGREMCGQPAGEVGGNVLCWNGEVFGGLEVKSEFSDTQVVLDEFSRACAAEDDGGERLLHAVACIEGPFAFIFWEEKTKKLWFGRDRLGRRSLLMRKLEDGGYEISSCSGSIQEKGWEEVTPDGIFFLQLEDEGSLAERFELHKLDWPLRHPPLHRTFGAEEASPAMSMEEAARELLLLLDRSVRRRVEGVERLARSKEEDGSPVAVMFSGGLDSTLLAALAHRHVHPRHAIELINVCFDPLEAPDRYTGVESLRELRSLFPERRWRLVAVDVTQEEVEERREEILSLIFPRATQMDFNIGSALWFGSRAAGLVLDDPREDRGEALSPHVLEDLSSRLQALKAGGCQGGGGEEAAGGAEEEEEEARDVRNGEEADEKEAEGRDEVGGEASLVGSYKPQRSEIGEVVRDILSARPQLGVKRVVEEIRRSRPTWLVGEGRVRPWMSKVKSSLPQQTAAARGCDGKEDGFVAGTSSDPRQWVRGKRSMPIAQVLGEGRPWVSRSSVLLLGMGADEQLCGYSRYRSRMKRGGEEGVLREMGRDMERIWQRNLGRDDRCISSHGREARFPFLDEEVVTFLSSLPLSSIADMSLPPGIGDKLLLRLVAEQVGLRRGAQEVKRAIQFGTRIAKQSNKLTFGSNRKGSGEARILDDLSD